ncbi:MAG: TolC family protein [Acidobacteria bacterium]|nr:TolC family protein [Acidobacteriota bacterium]
MILLILLATVALAQTNEMGLEDAVKYALANNKNIQADRKQLEIAAGRLKQAGLRANPMLETSGLSSLRDTSMKSASVMMSVPLEAGGRRSRRIEVAERELERMKYEVAERERRLTAEVRTKYGEAVEAMRNLELNDRLLELNQNSYRIIKARVTEGASAPLEQSQLQVEVSKLEAQKQTFASRVVVLQEELKALLGAEEDIKFRDEFSEIPLTLTKETLLQTAFNSRPDLQAARVAETVADAMIEQAKTEGKYDLSVFAELGFQSWRFDQFGFSHDGALERVAMSNGMVRAGVTITLPTRNKNQGNIEAAVAAKDEARLRREFIETMIRREVAAAYARWQGAARVLKTYNTDLLAASQNNLRVVRASFDLGYLRTTDVLAEQRRLVEVQMSYTAALKEEFLARTEVETVTGTRIGQ